MGMYCTWMVNRVMTGNETQLIVFWLIIYCVTDGVNEGLENRTSVTQL